MQRMVVNIFVLFFVFSCFLFTSSLGAQERLVLSRIEGDFIEVYVEKILSEAYRRIGIQVEYKQFPPKRSLLTSNQGLTDGEMIRIKGIEKEFPNLLMVASPVTSIEIVVFTKNQIFRVNGWQSLKPYRIAIVRGILVVEIGTKNMNTFSFNTMGKALHLVGLEKYDITILPRIDGLGHLKQLNIPNIEILEPPVARVDLYHYLHKRHEKLIPVITESLRIMNQDGTVKSMRDQFITELMK